MQTSITAASVRCSNKGTQIGEIYGIMLHVTIAIDVKRASRNWQGCVGDRRAVS